MEKKLIYDINFEKVWQEGIKDWKGNMPKQMVDDKCEEAFWEEYINKKAVESVESSLDDYTIPFYQELSSYFSSEDTILEIGPGWGNYTFSLSLNKLSL